MVTLSMRVLRLQLNTNSNLNLRSDICQNMTNFNPFSLSSGSSGDSEEIAIPLDQVFISQEDGEIVLTLANNESDRVSLAPSATRVTIMDDDSK